MKKIIPRTTFGSPFKIFAMVSAPAALLLACGCAHQGMEAMEQKTSYNQPLLSQGAIFGLLPPVVQNTIRAQVGMAEISAIHRLSGENPLIYRIDFARQEIYPPLFVGEDGAVLNPDLTVAIRSAAQALETLKPD